MIINKNLSKVIENETWTPISIMNSKIQNSVGFLLYGQQYLNRQGTSISLYKRIPKRQQKFSLKESFALKKQF